MKIHHSTMDNSSTPHDNATHPLIETAPVAIVVLIVLICAWVILVNTLVFICVITSSNKLKSVANIQILSLSFTDTFVGVCSLPLVLTYYITGSFPYYTSCAVLFMGYIIAQVATLFHAFGICLHRIISIRRRYKTPRKIVYRSLILQIVLTWVFAVVAVSVPFIMFGRFGEKMPFCSLNTLFGVHYHSAIGFYNALILVPHIGMNILYIYMYAYLRSMWKKTHVETELSSVHMTSIRPVQADIHNTDHGIGENIIQTNTAPSQNQIHEYSNQNLESTDEYEQCSDTVQDKVLENHSIHAKELDSDSAKYTEPDLKGRLCAPTMLQKTRQRKFNIMKSKGKTIYALQGILNKEFAVKTNKHGNQNMNQDRTAVDKMAAGNTDNQIMNLNGDANSPVEVISSPHENYDTEGSYSEHTHISVSAPSHTVADNQFLSVADCKPIQVPSTSIYTSLEVSSTPKWACNTVSTHVSGTTRFVKDNDKDMGMKQWFERNNTRYNVRKEVLPRHNVALYHRGQRRVLVTIGLILLSLNIFMTPLSLLIFLETLCEDFLSRKVKFILVDIALINSALNPIIYGFRIRPFREALKETLTRLSSCCRRTTQVTNIVHIRT